MLVWIYPWIPDFEVDGNQGLLIIHVNAMELQLEHGYAELNQGLFMNHVHLVMEL